MSSGYTFLCNTRKVRGGGVALLVSDDLSFTEVPSTLSSCESLIITLHLKGVLLTVVAVYRSRNACLHSFLVSLDAFLGHLPPSRLLLLAGDLNIDLLSITRLNPFYALLLDYGLCSLLTIPTRIDSHSRTLIDHLLVNSSALGLVTSGTFPLGFSDHLASFSVGQSVTPAKTVTL
eukprot:Pompholyxophrys_punicea_v1_NODE_240_length_2602_cov_8.890895.p1 type:complete len:176 gc:universal NODE_240_length_2602_cov_8.890895:2146-1619(-)